jgi:hypothetical protein
MATIAPNQSSLVAQGNQSQDPQVFNPMIEFQRQCDEFGWLVDGILRLDA